MTSRDEEISRTPTRRIFFSKQNYLGQTLNTTIHGRGFYEDQDQKIFYDGSFYANQLEGYSQIYYHDGSNFQGLFKANRRFGPGIFTYQNGGIDVGWWRDCKLVRLVANNSNATIPHLARNWFGKMLLLRFRHMVQVCQESEDLAKATLIALGANERVLEQYRKLYNCSTASRDDVFFDKTLYDETFFINSDCDIEVLDDIFYIDDDAVQLDEYQLKLRQRRLTVSELLVEKLAEIEKRLDALDSEIRSLTSRINYCKNCCHYNATYESEPSVDFEEKSSSSDTISDKSRSISSLALDNYEEKHSKASSKNTIAVPVETAFDPCFCGESYDVYDLAQLERDLERKTEEERFWSTISTNLRKKLDAIRRKLDASPRKTRKVAVKEIMAWNNESVMVEFQKHCFRHREFDGEATFDIYSLLSGQRQKYAAAGTYETNCLNFLNECAAGDTLTIIDYLRRRNVDVNVADGFGNTGIFYAAEKNRHEAIRILANFGANLNQINDEGLTPLNLIILLYLATKYNVDEWEPSFLPDISRDEFDDDVQTWQPRDSIKSIGGTCRQRKSITSSRSEKLISNMKSKSLIKKTPYVFDTSFAAEPVSDRRSTETIKADRHSSTKPKEFQYTGLDLVENIISTLLDTGADPNIGEVPFQALVLATFCCDEKIVREILEAKADIKAEMPDKNLNCLHLICGARCCPENVQICYCLLEYYCDCNAKASTNHWLDRKQVLLGKYAEADSVPDDGKNPLHLLCMRKDHHSDNCGFFANVAKALIEFQVNVEDTYLGHTPLSLAVMSGNLKLVTALLNCGFIDPYRELDYEMGNILTLFFLRRYEGAVPLEENRIILDHIVSLEVNPLKPVGASHSAIEFAEKELGVFIGQSDKGGKVKEKTSNISKDSHAFLLLEHLKDLARQMVLRCIQFKATKILYDLAEEKLLDQNYVKSVGEFLTPEVAFENLQLLFQNLRIEEDRFSKDLCLDVIEYVEHNKIQPKQRTGKMTNVKKTIASQSMTTVVDIRQKFTLLIDASDFYPKSKAEVVTEHLCHPALDHNFDPLFCYQCLRYVHHNFHLCTRCQLILFCSERCLKSNQKHKFGHYCDLKENKTSDVDLNQLYADVAAKCHGRLVMRKKKELEEERRKDEEERKNDTYGTRLLKPRKSPIICHYDSPSCELLKNVDTKTIEEKKRYTQTSFKTLYSTFNVNLDEKLRRLSSLEESYRKLIGRRRSTYCKKLHVKVSDEEYNGLENRKDKDTNVPSVPATQSKFERLKEQCLVHKKLKQIPKKPRRFMDLLGKYFPDVDLSYMMLPFVCSSDGQIYYRFSEENAFHNTYSAM